ncbi:MAG TPA: hypothetical protein PKO22_00905, partial [Treponemataceae bacterium]|nr:hypothetical protein [Treponemataceae bacterium]
MTSEFDKDEINDSSFPIDFNDDSTSLDMFGVWVKRGPRSASQASPAVAPAGLDEPTPMNASPSDRDFVDLSDLPELPDFGEPIPDEGELAQSAIIEPLMDEPAIVESAISEEIVYPEVNELESEPEPELIPEPELAQDDLMEINLDEFLGAGAEISESAINDETIQTEPSKTVEETIIPEEIVDFGVVEEPVAPEEMEISFDSADEMGIPSSLDEIESLKEPIEEADFSLPEKDNLPSDDDFSSFLDDLNSGSIVDSSAEPRPASTSTSVADDLDLDSFINSVNETGSSSHEDSEKVFSDTEPVDIELEFDESYIEDVQKIKAAGAASSDSEFFNQDFGVELIDETGGLSDNSADGIFESVSDIPSMEGGNSKETSDSSSLGIETTNEFDDLLSSLDLSPTPSMAVKSEAKPTAQSKKARFDLVVTDEGDESITSNVTETATDEDLEVSLTGDQTVKHVEQSPAKVQAQAPSSASIEEELADFFVKDELPAESPVEFLPEDHEPMIEDNLDIPEIRDYNETNSGENWVAPEVVPGEEEVSLDFDDISALEKDLNEANLEPGETQLTANDKSTELLMKIADELSSIKIELSTLKTELANVKPVSGDKLDTNVVDEQNSENSGFFTDDDTDETIALTGDELNNILITADFTEEKNADAEMAAEAESPEADILASIPMEAPVEEAVIEQSPVEET